MRFVRRAALALIFPVVLGFSTSYAGADEVAPSDSNPTASVPAPTQGVCDNRTTPDIVAAFYPRMVSLKVKQEYIQYYYTMLSKDFDEITQEELEWLARHLERDEGVMLPNHTITKEKFEELKRDPRMRLNRGGPEYAESAGSGTIFDDEGHVVTNYHVAGKKGEITAILANGKMLPAKFVGGLPKVDLSVLQIQDFPKDFKMPPFRAAPISSLRMGQFVITLGNGLDLGIAMSGGHISVPRQKLPGTPAYFDYLRITAPINHGNSGGAAIDGCDPGVMVGIPTAIIRGPNDPNRNTNPGDVAEGIGITIHAEAALKVAKRLAAGLPAGEGWVGIMTSSYDAARDSSIKVIYHYPNEIANGLVVSQVVPGSPAESKLRKNDLITSVSTNGSELKLLDTDQLLNLTLWMSPGEKIVIKGFRPNIATKSAEPISCDGKDGCEITIGKQDS